jgi:hypothetical protein
VNSDRADSFHSWSSDSRWIVFSSKRQDNVFTRPFFSHIDSIGNASKPFVLPQEDPLSEERSLFVYNVPELTKEPIHISLQNLTEAAFSEKGELIIAKLDSNVVVPKTENKSNPVVLNDISKKKNMTNRKASK